jgi:hypothetical protein
MDNEWGIEVGGGEEEENDTGGDTGEGVAGQGLVHAHEGAPAGGAAAQGGPAEEEGPDLSDLMAQLKGMQG